MKNDIELRKIIREEVEKVLREDEYRTIKDTFTPPKVHTPMLIGANDYHSFEAFKEFLGFITPEQWNYHEVSRVEDLNLKYSMNYSYAAVFFTEDHFDFVDFENLEYEDFEELVISSMDHNKVYNKIWSTVIEIFYG